VGESPPSNEAFGDTRIEPVEPDHDDLAETGRVYRKMPVTFWTTRRTAPTTRRQKRSKKPPIAARAEAIGMRVSGPRYKGAKPLWR
jgi:hypothetical protein